MSYPKNQPITYTSVPHTSGYPENAHTLTWVFSDGETGTGKTVQKTWTSSSGVHTATVTAVNTFTAGTAEATKDVVIDTYIWEAFGPVLTESIRGPMYAQIDDNRILIAGGRIGNALTPSSRCYIFEIGRAHV